MPSLALLARRRPSNVNGRVTTATVNAPSSLEILAMNGAAPVPVPAAHAGRDKYHITAFDRFTDLRFSFFCGFASEFRIAAGAQTFRRIFTQYDLIFTRRVFHDLYIGVADIERYTLHTTCDHAVNGIRSAAADSEHFNVCDLIHFWHFTSLLIFFC
jgi:hypothetical protein